MSNVINLRSQRKAKLRQKDETKAEQNRQIHGQTKADKKLKKAREKLAAKAIDAHKREDGSDAE